MSPELVDPLNICIVAERFPILGRASDHGFLWPIARGLASRGHNVTVLAWKNPQGKPEIQQDNVQAYFLGEPYGLDRSEFPELVLKKFETLHREKPFQIVHSIDKNGYLIGLNKKNFKVAMAYDVEATEMAQLFSILGMARDTVSSLLQTSVAVFYKFMTTYWSSDRKLLKTADGIFVTNPMQRIILERYYLYPEYHTYLVPYGIEIRDLSPREKSNELRQKLSIPLNAKVVVTITDMQEVAEIKNLLIAFEKVAVKKPSARLIIVGSGPKLKQIEYQTYMLALGTRVVFAGAVRNSDLPDYIALADVFINISSRTTGFEPNLLEAMAQQKVIVGSEVSPIATIVEDGDDGFLIRPADTTALTHLLLQIFTEQLPVEKIGEHARNKVLDLFDSNKMVDQTLEAYRNTLKKSGHQR
ncbi:MAG: glycosyltransferase family 4 protein [Pseudobdellovibrionaceae bacterium]|nr:glycosyltransferase family 4 protein [Bdellovibrionales bacterium]USN47382.1 MAG: glycosyltransferase family 4 protein [Pseudobdellovibrionaceae bacterium]